MLNKTAFANSLAIAAALFYVLLYIIDLVAPPVFEFLFNAQFLGANVASLLPPDFTFGNFLAVLIIVVAITWIFGYLWAAIYNRLSK